MRRLAAALSAFAVAVTLGACGDGGDGGDGGDAAPNDSGGGSQQAASNLVALAKSVGDQAVRTSTAHLELTADLGGQQVTGEGDIRIDEQDAAIRMDVSTPQGEMAMTLVDEVLYLRLPEEAEPGKPWVEIDANGDDPMAQVLGGVTDQLRENADPRRTLDRLKNAGTITDERREELNGEQTTHYSITVDVDRLAEELTDPELKKAMQQTQLKDFPVELWVNEDGLPVRMKLEMPPPGPASGTATTAGVQVDYSDWGEPVEIAAPPADQIARTPR